MQTTKSTTNLSSLEDAGEPTLYFENTELSIYSGFPIWNVYAGNQIVGYL